MNINVKRNKRHVIDTMYGLIFVTGHMLVWTMGLVARFLLPRAFVQ